MLPPSDLIFFGAIAAVVIFLLVGNALFSTILENPKVLFKEAPLEKNKELQLKPGETYTYSFTMNNSSVEMNFRVVEGRGCTGIMMLEAPNASGVCLDRWGMEENGSNSAFTDPSILIFKPWMLALEEGWGWNNSMYVSYDGGENHVGDTFYRVVRMENYSGRESYLVEISSDTGPAEYDWVDSDRRILLRAIGEGYEVKLEN